MGIGVPGVPLEIVINAKEGGKDYATSRFHPVVVQHA